MPEWERDLLVRRFQAELGGEEAEDYDAVPEEFLRGD